jgi:hypothetical protein
MRYKTQYRKLNIEQLTRTPLQTGVNSRGSEKLDVPATLVIPVYDIKI